MARWSLLSLWPDFKPGLMGIKDYQYEPKGEAYNVVFEQMAGGDEPSTISCS